MGTSPQGGGWERRGLGRAVVPALATLAAALGAAAVAQAQLPEPPSGVPAEAPRAPGQDGGIDLNPCTTVNQNAGQQTCDTEVTPAAKSSDLWTQVGGAVFDEGGDLVKGSFTPYTVDFYAVDFLNQTHGIAGGAACEDPDTSFDELESCTRVPVIWAFTDTDGEGPVWREVYRGDDPGFVGAVSYFGKDGALAVGGSGEYPYREFSIDSTSDPDSDPSGKGRVWQLDADGSWREYDEDELPEAPNLDASGNPALPVSVPTPMRALTALDCKPTSAKVECVAGGLQQLFMWRDGAFYKAYGNGSPDKDPPVGQNAATLQSDPGTEVSAAADLRFRVRSLQFVPADGQYATLVGVTSGCCDLDPANNIARMLMFDDRRWYVRPLYSTAAGARARQTSPDSYYSVETSVNNGFVKASVTAAAGGPELPAEPPSRVGGDITVEQQNGGAALGDAVGVIGVAFIAVQSPSGGSGLPAEATQPTLADMRLVAGAGDVAGPPAAASVPPLTPGGPDHWVDWAVGESRSTGRAIAYTTTTTPHGVHPPSPVDCKSTEVSAEVSTPTPDPRTCQPSAQDAIVRRTQSDALYQLDSYRLNAFAMVPSSGIGWAVGDKGALERLGGSGASATTPEPAPPRLGRRTPSTDPGTGPYGSGSPAVSDDPGTVPPLAERTTTSERQLVSYGTPDTDRYGPLPLDDVTTMITSRDGSEAWALGPGDDPTGQPGFRYRGGTTLYHFDGSSWTKCDPEGVRGQLAAGESCEALAPLLRNVTEIGNVAPVRFLAAARVPLENDGDPTNDDEFEAVAFGSVYSEPGSDVPQRCTVMHLEDGRWSLDSDAMRQFDLDGTRGRTQICFTEAAFTSPSDGWAVSNAGEPWHFDGDRWVACLDDPAACDDDPSEPTLPLFTRGSSLIRPLQLATAGRRVYLYGARAADGATGTGLSAKSNDYPLILYKDPGEGWTDGSGGGEEGGGLDPGCASRDSSGACVPDPAAAQGVIDALSVAAGSEGRLTGWASGTAGAKTNQAFSASEGMMLQLRAGPNGGYAWQRWTAPDATADYSSRLFAQSFTTPRLLTLPPSPGQDQGEALLLPTTVGATPDGPLMWFNPAQNRWEVYRTPFALPLATHGNDTGHNARLRAIVPDSEGGAWMAVRRLGGESGGGPGFRASSTYFFRYTNRIPVSQFSDVPNPITSGQEITGAAAAGDGSFWLSTDSAAVYRYDRRTGWHRFAVPGWDAGRVVTRPSHAFAIAVGDDGNGLVVGEQGRIADLSPRGAVLNVVAGTTCAAQLAPCGTGRNLRAVAIAPGGSALVGGDERALLWRPEGEDFRAVSPPRTSAGATITSISMPSSGTAWLATSGGQVFAGTLSGSDWSWKLENVSPDGTILSSGTEGRSGSVGEDVPLNAIAVNAEGYGLAVGDQGVVEERSHDGTWRRLGGQPLQSYRSVALPTGGSGDGALVGGQYGQILTLDAGRLRIARHANAWDPISNTTTESFVASRSAVIGLGLVPGEEPGQVEAWAVEQGATDHGERVPAPNAILHYASDTSDPLLAGGLSPAAPLRDAPAAQPGEVTFAAFGKSECREGGHGSQTTISPGALTCPEPTGANTASEAISRGIAERLTGSGSPDFTLFTGDAVDAAGGDSSIVNETSGSQSATDYYARPANPTQPSLNHKRWIQSVADRFVEGGAPLFGALGGQDLSRTAHRQPGLPMPWMKTMAAMPEPWGRGGEVPDHNGLSFRPVPGSGAAFDPSVASTHYAVDIERDGNPVARLVVLDTSLKSLAAENPTQNPTEDQTTWLKSVLCRPGEETTSLDRCTRAAGQRAIVLSETPTYSYGPGSAETQTDSAQLEALLFQYQVDLVVSGRLGWNGLYYTQDTGIHSPQPGGAYPEGPPAPLRGDGQLIANVVAASAGGNFATGAASTEAGDGFWHGYTMVRLDPESGDVSVEQRPILDWLELSASTHTLRAGRKLQLSGVGREPPGFDQPLRFDQISSPAITHRFDLLEADPDRPWLPLEASDNGVRDQASERLGESDPCEQYRCLNPSIGKIDDQSGEVTAGKGNYPRTFAVAQLSVGDKVATYPLVFEPRAAFKPKPAPSPPSVSVPPPATPPAAVQPTTPSVNLPPPPVLPVLAAPTPAPPPAPPTPPTVASETPLDLNLAPSGLDVTPPTAVSQPPTPPVNPAPPSGARREARQRQAAAQKSGADSAEEGSEGESTDLADKPPSAYGTAEMSRKPAEASRRSTQRSQPSFTPVDHTGQPSAWARDALIGGGLGVAALILALGLRTALPTPRRREPELPAPAWARRPKR